ncbi:hypothetical protein AXF42_Ash020116 [Apostasia shenzhenica]|uniref:Uncharacterized protein n=1 Tax=Apostasia shenzhenica TaxID=1088818 RepID=A0A2I0A3P0_9ASPA|nr:hypothetical protein AXF42_Ash020116 [Apostasia shenzhenica]
MPAARPSQTSYSLAFGGKALIPVELEVHSPYVELASSFKPQALLEWQQQNDDSRRLKLNLLEENRDLAALKQVEHKQRITKYYNKHVWRRPFQEGELVF